ncbi:4'-phosphopantetheinyl transferase family protein [Micromonospora deserti]|uniref:4-phosphopantetheinyl transferase n=1 Tax=Micromonospora deserti TaxID=2070366 RepID=A0A2W2CFQ0_9ACTN|nr:4'-phosphopantetheinyl transferase superfamily protein [Micromonospora deserti]PZF98211.1 4-phosphopantetheinyl transferase [Micromonospora deserti]
MSQLPAPDRDTVYVWVGRTAGDRPEAARRLLRRAGATLLGHAEERVVVGHRSDGRPVVRVPGRGGGQIELPVSLSRSGAVLVVAARPGGPVGVDVERLRPLPALPLALRWFDPAEAAWLAGRPGDGRAADFLRLWTAKEAVGKALGVGLRGGGLRRAVPVPGMPGAPLRPVPGLAGLRVGHPGAGEDLVLAVAVVDDSEVAVEVMQGAGHRTAAVRSASTERTSLPVVVRGS